MKMSTKIIFLGILSSIILIISCIYSKYDTLINKNIDKKLISTIETKEVISIPNHEVVTIHQLTDEEELEIEKGTENRKVVDNQESFQEKQVVLEEKKEQKMLKVSSLEYKAENELVTIDGKMPILENDDDLKRVLMSRCEKIHCDKKILFSPEQVSPKWKELATQTIKLFNSENVKMANLKVDGNSIYISGEFKDKQSMAKLDDILKPYLSVYSIKNDTKVKEVKKEVKVETPKKVNSKNSSISIIEEKISDILKEKHINFYKSRARITKRGKKTLDEIILILKKQKNIQIEVDGHTDASGNAKTNQWISAERAKSVKNYLGSRGLNPKSIIAKGFGETRLLLKNKPYSAVNRRVEIKIKRK